MIRKLSLISCLAIILINLVGGAIIPLTWSTEDLADYQTVPLFVRLRDLIVITCDSESVILWVRDREQYDSCTCNTGRYNCEADVSPIGLCIPEVNHVIIRIINDPLGIIPSLNNGMYLYYIENSTRCADDDHKLLLNIVVGEVVFEDNWKNNIVQRAFEENSWRNLGYQITVVENNVSSIETCFYLSQDTVLHENTILNVTVNGVQGTAKSPTNYSPTQALISFANITDRRCLIWNISYDELVTENSPPIQFSISLQQLNTEYGIDREAIIVNIINIDYVTIDYTIPEVITVIEGNHFNICVAVVNGTLAEGVTAQIRHSLSANHTGEIVPSPQHFRFTNLVSHHCLSFMALQQRRSRRLTFGNKKQFILTLHEDNVLTQFIRNTTVIDILEAAATFGIQPPFIRVNDEPISPFFTKDRLCIHMTSDIDLLMDVTLAVSVSSHSSVEHMDYTIDTSDWIIPRTAVIGENFCRDIEIHGDSLYEGNENLSVSFKGLRPGVSFENVSEYVIVIQDDIDSHHCRHLQPIVNGYVQQQNNISSIATYHCVDGYEIVPAGKNTRTCTPNGWDGHPPICVVSCPLLPNLQFGITHYRFRGRNGYLLEGERAFYECNPGYSLKGFLIRRCLSNGTWSDSEPTCVVNDCGPLRSPRHGSVMYSSSTPGSKAIYSCDPHYFLMGNFTNTCQRFGDWQFTEPPVCADGTKDKVFILTRYLYLFLLVFLSHIVIF